MTLEEKKILLNWCELWNDWLATSHKENEVNKERDQGYFRMWDYRIRIMSELINMQLDYLQKEQVIKG